METIVKHIKLTVAQFRLACRLKAGLRAPVARYHAGTIRALARKHVVSILLDLDKNEPIWELTSLGYEVIAAKGHLKVEVPSRRAAA